MTNPKFIRAVDWRPPRGFWRVVAAGLLTIGCGAEPETSAPSSGVKPEVAEEEYSPDDERDLDLAIRLEETLSETAEAIARFEDRRPDLRGVRQARLQAAIEGLSALLVDLEELSRTWSEADEPLRGELESEIEELLDEMDAGLVRGEELAGPEST